MLTEVSIVSSMSLLKYLIAGSKQASCSMFIDWHCVRLKEKDRESGRKPIYVNKNNENKSVFQKFEPEGRFEL